ncbi:hypothetical protein PVN32_15260 [Bacillus paralicheniformis]|uniref:Uncharacterized protein n=1 Tax=Bacillus paralicheniformis TaxID=1648923 RepID=A0AAW6KD79_9BACI|nr:hypothetical protein [Bacillus paralicheniformis]MDE1453530.1 hypothetical protein [Bacillus paralicheniformis]
MADNRESIEMGSNQMYETDNAADKIRIKLDVDVSDVITGLKAVQREAKAATKALAEFQDLAERLGEKPLANGWEIARSLRAVLDKDAITKKAPKS